MRKPARPLVSRQQKVIEQSFPAPIGGWNARDPLAKMSPLDAVSLDNFHCQESTVDLRGGSQDFATGLPSLAKSLYQYAPPGSINRMFAFTDNGVFDVSNPGPVGASVATSTNGYWNGCQMGTSGGTTLCVFNGVDKPLYYNGTTWTSIDGVSTPAITGVVTTQLVSCTVFKRRLFMLQTAFLGFWYLPIDSIGGAAQSFNLAPLCQRGGFIMAIGTWTLDGGNGPDDYFVALTSEGEAIVYQGADPADASNWSLVGVYVVPKPIGRRCLRKMGGDMAVITEGGILPLSKMLQSAAVDYKIALTNKIEFAFTDQSNANKGNVGWDITLYPAQSAAIFNIPQTANGTIAIQYVMNTITKAWSSFSGWNASCFCEHNSELYFATGTKVVKAWAGTSDNGTIITAVGQTAYNYFGTTQSKSFELVRPQLLADGQLSFNLGISVDFQQISPLALATFTPPIAALWDSAIWDEALWAYSLEIQKDWRTAACYDGYCASLIVQVCTNSLNVQWVANDYTFQPAGVLA